MHLSRRLKCTIVIIRCPSSIRRPSSLTFHIFDFSSETLNWIQQNMTGSKISTSSTKFVFFGPIGKTRWPPWPLIGWDTFGFYSVTTEWNSMKLDGKQDLNILYQFCVFVLIGKQDSRPDFWLAETFSTSPLKLLNGIQLNLTGSKISTSSTNFVFFEPVGKTRWLPWPLIDWDIFYFSAVSANRIQQNLTGSKISTSSSKFVFFGPIGKTRWPPWPLIDWNNFNFSSETAEQNSMKLDRKQDLNVLFRVWVFRADRKNKMAALASDWLRHFWLLLWNCWTEFKETWQEARPQRPLPIWCFSGRSEEQDGRRGLWLAETFSSSPLKPPNGIQWNLAGGKISTSSTKFVFWVDYYNTKFAALANSWNRLHIVLRSRYVAFWASCLKETFCLHFEF